MNSALTTTAPEVRLPPWLWGNDVLGFARQAQLKLHPIDASAYRWRIEALERFEHRAAHLVELIEIAAPGASARWEALRNLPVSPVPNSVPHEVVDRKRREFADAAPGDLLAQLNWIHMSMALSPDEHFLAAAQSAFENLRSMKTPEGAPALPGLAAYFIRFDSALSLRANFARIMLRIEEEPALLTNRPQQFAGQPVFGSAWNLQTDLTLTRDAYIAPLFLCHSPWVWAITGPRLQGVMVFSLGTPLRGRLSDPAELLQQFMPAGPNHFNACPLLVTGQTSAATTWWTERLNAMLSRATDPASYTDRAGRYHPRRQFEAMLSLEQAGCRVQGVLAHQRDQPTRRLIAFAGLDTLADLGIGRFDTSVSLARAERALTRLETLLPSDAAEVLLPTARRAVAGLRDCQQGFFPSGRVSNGQVTVPNRSGPDSVKPAAEATAAYLRVLRNANHGYGGQDDKGRRRDEVLLMSHTGVVPGDLALLPYLYWLELLADPLIHNRAFAARE